MEKDYYLDQFKLETRIFNQKLKKYILKINELIGTNCLFSILYINILENFLINYNKMNALF